jgi:hypothetical protein
MFICGLCTCLVGCRPVIDDVPVHPHKPRFGHIPIESFEPIPDWPTNSVATVLTMHDDGALVIQISPLIYSVIVDDGEGVDEEGNLIPIDHDEFFFQFLHSNQVYLVAVPLSSDLSSRKNYQILLRPSLRDKSLYTPVRIEVNDQAARKTTKDRKSQQDNAP